MPSTLSLTVRSIKAVTVQGGGYGDETTRIMREIKASDQEPGPFSKLEMIVSQSDAIGMNLTQGAAIALQVSSTELAIDAVAPASITEDVETEVLIAGRGFTADTVVQVFDDQGVQIGSDFVPTIISPNALTVDITIADAVVGSIGVEDNGSVSNALTFTVAAA